MSTSSFATDHPIHNEADLGKAMSAAKTPADKKHTHQRAATLGLLHRIPTHWKKTDGSFNEDSAGDDN